LGYGIVLHIINIDRKPVRGAFIARVVKWLSLLP